MLSSVGSGNDHQQTDTYSYNAHTGKPETVSGFRYSVLSYNKFILSDAEDNYYKTYEYDNLGRISSVTIGLQRKEMLAFTLNYDSAGHVKSKTIKNHEGRPSEENYSYKKSHELGKIWGPENFNFDHDENGNLIRIHGPSGEEVFTYDIGDRVERLVSNGENSKISYDPITGCVSSITSEKRSEKFWHDARGKLVQSVNFDSPKGQKGTRTSYQYDYLGRLVAFLQEVSGGRRMADKAVTQLFYADPRHPYRVSHVRNPRLTQRLLYDNEGQLISVQTKDQKLFVATDHMGSPVLVFRPDGTVDKTVKYSAFGDILADSSPAMTIPVGYKGGIILGAGLLLIDQRVYNVQLRQWLNPDWESLQKPFTNPNSLFVYRAFNNNPIDLGKPITYEEASSLNFWAKLYGYDMDAMMNTTKQPPSQPEDHLLANPVNQKLASGLDEALSQAKQALQEISLIPTPKAKERLVLNPSFASSSSGFGNGFLLTPMISNGVTYANVVEGAQGVVQNIFLSVLNGSKLLDEISYVKSAKQGVYYFAKKTGTSSDIAEALMSSDMDTVNRLAGQYKVKVSPLKQRGKELVIENEELSLHVLYSDSPSINNFKDSVLQEAIEESMTSAWLRERNLIQAGFTGYGDWTSGQKSELIAMRPGFKSTGVRGYEAVEIQPRIKYPHLVRDESNFGFVSETLQQRRRKNRHQKSRKFA